MAFHGLAAVGAPARVIVRAGVESGDGVGVSGEELGGVLGPQPQCSKGTTRPLGATMRQPAPAGDFSASLWRPFRADSMAGLAPRALPWAGLLMTLRASGTRAVDSL